jgi:hypothetical protein
VWTKQDVPTAHFAGTCVALEQGLKNLLAPQKPAKFPDAPVGAIRTVGLEAQFCQRTTKK